MGKTIDELEDELKELKKSKEERDRRKALELEIRELREEGTLKAKIKKAFKKTRDHLHKKGQQFNETGEKQQTSISNNIVELSKKSEFGVQKGVIEEKYESPLYKELTKENN